MTSIPYNANYARMDAKGVYRVTAVDISNVSADLFIFGVVFILLVFGLLSFGILRMFQQRYRDGWICFALAVVSFIVCMWILNRWFL